MAASLASMVGQVLTMKSCFYGEGRLKSERKKQKKMRAQSGTPNRIMIKRISGPGFYTHAYKDGLMDPPQHETATPPQHH
eukprot:scaffold2655_cov179-Amphora_coffeaeformis.AAC.27